MARFFGVSQIPVREALKVLLGEGLVEHVPHVGYSVAMLAFAEFRELYDVRAGARAAALAHAVAAGRRRGRRRRVRRSPPRRSRPRWPTGDERGYHAAPRAFHLALMAPAGMQRLVHMYEAAWNMTEPARPMSHVEAGDRRGASTTTTTGCWPPSWPATPVRCWRESEGHYDHLRAADRDVPRRPGRVPRQLAPAVYPYIFRVTPGSHERTRPRNTAFLGRDASRGSPCAAPDRNPEAPCPPSTATEADVVEAAGFPPGRGVGAARLRPAPDQRGPRPLKEQTWTTYNIFAFWMSDVHSVGGYVTAGSLFALGLTSWQVFIA